MNSQKDILDFEYVTHSFHTPDGPLKHIPFPSIRAELSSYTGTSPYSRAVPLLSFFVSYLKENFILILANLSFLRLESGSEKEERRKEFAIAN